MTLITNFTTLESQRMKLAQTRTVMEHWLMLVMVIGRLVCILDAGTMKVVSLNLAFSLLRQKDFKYFRANDTLNTLFL